MGRGIRGNVLIFVDYMRDSGCSTSKKRLAPTVGQDSVIITKTSYDCGDKVTNNHGTVIQISNETPHACV